MPVRLISAPGGLDQKEEPPVVRRQLKRYVAHGEWGVRTNTPFRSEEWKTEKDRLEMSTVSFTATTPSLI